MPTSVHRALVKLKMTVSGLAKDQICRSPKTKLLAYFKDESTPLQGNPEIGFPQAPGNSACERIEQGD
jgi:hypothetical protein